MEHHKQTLVIWRGRRGRVYMFPAELPYTEPHFSADQVGYYVSPHALPHTAVGIGVYAIFGATRHQVALMVPRGAVMEKLLAMQIEGRADAFRYLACTSDLPPSCCCTQNSVTCPPQGSVQPLRLRQLPWYSNATAGAALRLVHDDPWRWEPSP